MSDQTALPIPIQWFPGHIAKTTRLLKQNLALVDLVIMVLDARIPLSSQNQSLLNTLNSQHKPILWLLNKADLADAKQTQRWQSVLSRQSQTVLPFEATQAAKSKPATFKALQRLGEPVLQKLEAKGLRRRPLRAMVVGMPNVGKSTIINALIGQKKAQTGHKAGVTRQTQWVRVLPWLELMDSPGLIPPKLDAPETGWLLATVHSVGEAAFEEEPVAQALLGHIHRLYPGLLHQHYQLDHSAVLLTDALAEAAPTLEVLALARGCLLPQAQPDTRRMAQTLLQDFRKGRLGRLTLEDPSGP